MSELWPLKTLGELCQIRRGQSPRPIKAHITDDEDGVNWIKIKDAGDDGKYIFKAKQKIHKKSAEKLVIVNDGDFILTNSMSFGRPYIVRTTGCVHDGWLIFSEYQNHLNQDYLYYALNSPNVSNQFEQMARGSTVRNLNIELVKKTVLPVPPLEEQQRIVSILDEAFKNIKSSIIQVKYKEKSAIELSKSSLTSVFRELNAQIKVKIGEFCKTTSGSTPRKSNKDYHTNGTIPWLLSGEVNTKEINESKNFITELALKETSVKLFPPDSVLVAMYGATAGQVGILRFPSTTNQAICGIFPNDKILPEYLYYVLQNANAELVAQASGSAQPNLSQQKIKALSIPLPSLNEQSEIIQQLEFLSQNINQIKHICLQELDSYNELRRSLLQEAFSGKLTGGSTA